MNLGIIFSYMIAGFLLIMITTIGYSTNFSGSELTISQIQKEKVSVVKDLITYDIPKAGYNLDNLPDTLLRAVGPNFIEFNANIDNSADGSLEIIRWEFTKDSVTETENPKDFILQRTVIGSTTEVANIKAGIISFTIDYYTELGSDSPVSLPLTAAANKSEIDDIVQLEINMISESAIPLQYSSQTDERYPRSSWTKRFSPVNLRDN